MRHEVKGAGNSDTQHPTPNPTPCSSVVKIGSIDINPPLILAPMAGATNHAFRLICKKAGGVGLVCTEMISSFGLTYDNLRTKEMIDWTTEERPVSVQIFGADPAAMAEGARQIEESGADIIDINIGCPVPKVVKTGAAGALLQDFALAEKVISSVVKSVKVPVTVKTRKGWDSTKDTAVELAKIAENAGVKAIAVHGRTVKQGYQGRADWSIIRRVKEAVSITVIGNGDVRTPQNAAQMFDETGCDAVMIGRGALGNPWLFHRIAHYLKTGELLPEPSLAMRIEAAKRHATQHCEMLGEERGVRELRGQLAWYIKGATGAPRVRLMLTRAKTMNEIEEALGEARS